MPCRHVIHQRPRKWIEFIVEGRVAPGDILDAVDRLFGDPDFERGLDTLVDGSGVTNLAGATMEIMRMAKRWGGTRGEAKRGRDALVASHPMVFGVIRMCMAFASRDSSAEARVFKTPEEAMAWLEVNAEAAAAPPAAAEPGTRE